MNLDPLEFRLKNLKDARLRAVLEAAAKHSAGARQAAATGLRHRGSVPKRAAMSRPAPKSSSPTSGRVQVLRAVTAFECGAVVNPDHLKNQVEGAIIMGLGGALFEAIQFEDGKILNPRFSKYRVPRFRDAPESRSS